jgi:hypothetical protein
MTEALMVQLRKILREIGDATRGRISGTNLEIMKQIGFDITRKLPSQRDSPKSAREYITKYIAEHPVDSVMRTEEHVEIIPPPPPPPPPTLPQLTRFIDRPENQIRMDELLKRKAVIDYEIQEEKQRLANQAEAFMREMSEKDAEALERDELTNARYEQRLRVKSNITPQAIVEIMKPIREKKLYVNLEEWKHNQMKRVQQALIDHIKNNYQHNNNIFRFDLAGLSEWGIREFFDWFKDRIHEIGELEGEYNIRYKLINGGWHTKPLNGETLRKMFGDGVSGASNVLQTFKPTVTFAVSGLDVENELILFEAFEIIPKRENIELEEEDVREIDGGADFRYSYTGNREAIGVEPHG